MIYIQEAHPSDAWQLAINERQNVVFASPKSYDERTGVAQSCVRNLGIRLPALVDAFQNPTEAAYTGWPDRIYVVDREGRIAYKSKPGPYGFSTQHLDEALARLIS